MCRADRLYSCVEGWVHEVTLLSVCLSSCARLRCAWFLCGGAGQTEMAATSATHEVLVITLPSATLSDQKSEVIQEATFSFCFLFFPFLVFDSVTSACLQATLSLLCVSSAADALSCRKHRGRGGGLVKTFWDI